MARHGAGDGAFQFDLEPEGDEEDVSAPDVAAPFSRTSHPARGRRHGGTLLIDLDSDPASPAPDPLPSGGTGDGVLVAGRRLHDLLRGRRLLAVVVLAALALTALVVDTVGDRGRVAALRTAPGGVLDLAGAPHEVWRIAAEGRVPGGLVGAAEGIVITQHRDALRGIDVATGARLWTADLPAGTNDCGPGMDLWSGVFQVEHTDRVVCVTTPVRNGRAGSPPSMVTVVDTHGVVVGAREIDPDGARLSPGPEGGLIVASWPDEARPWEGASTRPLKAEALLNGRGTVQDGDDLTVRFEDAATGDRRWGETIGFDGDVGPYLCTGWNEDGDVGEVELRGDVQTMVRDRTIWVGGCGIDAWLTVDGDRLDRPADPTTFEGFGLEALDAGGFVAERGEGLVDDPAGTDRVLSADGERSRALDGRYLAPQSTDGSQRDVLLVRRDDGLVAVDRSGQERWRTDVAALAQPVRTEQVAVVVDESRAVHGLDLGTGEDLWVRDDLFDGVDVGALTYGPHVMDGAFTDGRLAAFVVPERENADRLHWFAVDVATGEDLWAVTRDVEDWGAHLAVDGHLVRWSPTEIVGLSSGNTG